MKKGQGNVNIDSIRHSLAHALAMAVLKMFPTAKLGVGPIIENGFYYDFELPSPITEADFEKLEKSMRGTIARKLDFAGRKITAVEAKKIFKDQPFKLDLIKDFVKEKLELTVYQTGEFTDLCRGGHVKNTYEINPDAFKLTKVAGAYWKGSEKKPQLTRIYGAAFATKEELDGYIKRLAEAATRDHRKLGRELGLFVFSELVGPGLPLYTPKGAGILNAIKDYSRELRKEIGYKEVQTPNMNKGELFKRSGHYDKFKENMFLVRSNYTEEEYFLKPMNCPQHTQIFAAEPRSYKDLPLKLADFAVLYRDEKPGELGGLTRLRAFSQDDGHCFCREDQIEREFELVLGVIKKAMERYGLSYYVRLSLRDEKNKRAYLGSDDIWQKSQKTLRELLEKRGVEFVVAEGEAAFYGPKMDLLVRDSLGREWQLSTIQLDFNMPERFGLSYTDTDGKKQSPVMIHSALVGSPERFLGILIEHYAGAFPLWLAPVQVTILPINDKVLEYCVGIRNKLYAVNMRVSMDERNETIGKKIREAELQKIPYILVVGEREASSETVSVRERGKGDTGAMSIAKFLDTVYSRQS
ncbi:MAG: threonine--tRNA ligase [bacterium]|nr:threonine--tRNA ligase [bacterium]